MGEIQIIKITVAGLVGALSLYYIKDLADSTAVMVNDYLELKALSTMPESYWDTKQKETEAEVKKVQIREAAENKRKQEEIAYRKEKDEKDRAHQLEVMEKEKAYPESYWTYKTEEVKAKTLSKTMVKKEEASVERQKTIWNALSTGFDLFTRRYL